MTTKKELQTISEEIQKLIDLSKEPSSIKIKAGKTVIKKGETGNFLYIVKEGAIDIMSDDVRLERVRPGGVIGEMTLVDDIVRSAAAIAHKDSVLIPIGKSRFLHLIRMNP